MLIFYCYLPIYFGTSVTKDGMAFLSIQSENDDLYTAPDVRNIWLIPGTI